MVNRLHSNYLVTLSTVVKCDSVTAIFDQTSNVKMHDTLSIREPGVSWLTTGLELAGTDEL